MNTIRRIYVEKKKGFDVEAAGLLKDLKHNLRIPSLKELRILNRYDVQDIDESIYKAAIPTVFSDPPVDRVYEESFELEKDETVFGVEYLPGQYDQRADSASQCLQLISQGLPPQVKTAKIIILKGSLSAIDLDRIKTYCINPVDSCEADLAKPHSLEDIIPEPPDIERLEGFSEKNDKEIDQLRAEMDLAMSSADLRFCRDYFKKQEKRDPTITEIRVLDTYWSDHCRHTTFLTEIKNVHIDKGRYSGPVTTAYQAYLNAWNSVYKRESRPVCLMDIATLAMKEMRSRGLLEDLDLSEEINACSIKVQALVNGKPEDWLVMFKNETHNHPTEIEPFGGAATCLGGAIRDPLSGRTYVYQAMRVTGSADPRKPIEATIPGKLPQRTITTKAAQGYSSYGNQIGIATGKVAEIYDEGYLAKRMEIGAVIGAAPAGQVQRQKPVAGDIVLLVGGRTGRDGIGGATGSSKAHTEHALKNEAEVQKGNPPIERKLQRLFRIPEVSRMIKRCNDFGAGGVSVAIGELTDGLDIYLDAVPKKYEGLDGTELALSESQERMAVVISAEDLTEFLTYTGEENLEATQVAEVTDSGRLRMFWKGDSIVDISRSFLNTNGVRQETDVIVEAASESGNYFTSSGADQKTSGSLKKRWLDMFADLNLADQRGLIERFDATIGGFSVLHPLGGIYQQTPAECMVSKLPALHGDASTVTLMSHGYNPRIARWSPFHGAVYAVLESIARIVATGGDYKKIRLTLQEYFEKLHREPARWGKPFSALLGAFYIQNRLGIPAIGGKDSMSGSFNEMDVPPTLVSFAVCTADADHIISPEFKQSGSQVVLVSVPRDQHELPEFDILESAYSRVNDLIRQGTVHSAQSVGQGGLANAISRMSLGNQIGFAFHDSFRTERLFIPDYGSLVLELKRGTEPADELDSLPYELLGMTIRDKEIRVGEDTISLSGLIRHYETPLKDVFPQRTEYEGPDDLHLPLYTTRRGRSSDVTIARPRIIIPAFPGTNCEYDSARQFELEGAEVETFVFRNLGRKDVIDSTEALARGIRKSQILMLPGGFSAGDEPEGSGKFIAAVFRNPVIHDAVSEMLQKRDGLILGICNGFQALVKLGLLPYGEIREITDDCPTLTFNTIGRHVSRMVSTRIVSVLSPWYSLAEAGDVHVVPVSHGEGRFVANESTIKKLISNGQVATQYVDLHGKATMDSDYNPNGSYYAIEGITSSDGRILGKMAHSERRGTNIGKNIPGNKDQKIFASGIYYFK